MTAAIDKIAGFVSGSTVSRSSLRRDGSKHHVSRFMARTGRAIREWGYSTGLYDFRLKGRYPSQLMGSPDDPAPGNATLGSALLGGDMLFGGEQRAVKADFWQTLASAPPEFQRYAHSFHWLQDLAHVADQNKASLVAADMLANWFEVSEAWEKTVWDPEVLARRIINWFSHAPLILSSDDMVYRSKVLHTAARQLRHLGNTLNDAPYGLPRVYAGSALALGGLLLQGNDAMQVKGLRSLEQTVRVFILPDGGPESRNASDAIRCMQMLVLIREAIVAVNADLPPWIQVTLDRIAPFVRSLRHGDGSFAHIGGVSAEGGHGTNAILAASEASGKAIENAPHVGVQRVEAGPSCLLMDTSPAPSFMLSEHAPAATGAFEFSVGQERLVVNMGPAAGLKAFGDLPLLARSTAAQSTLVIGDTNSSAIGDDGRIISGVSETQTTREILEDGTLIRLIHNGYEKRFGVLHERELELRKDGKRLKGRDRISGRKLKKCAGQAITLRFHLHPQVMAAKGPDGRISLETRGGKSWIFDVEGFSAEIEDSLYLPRPETPQPCKQIVITADADGQSPLTLHWNFSEISL